MSRYDLEQRLLRLEDRIAGLRVLHQENELYRTAIDLIANGKPNPVAIAEAVKDGVSRIREQLDD